MRVASLLAVLLLSGCYQEPVTFPVPSDPDKKAAQERAIIALNEGTAILSQIHPLPLAPGSHRALMGTLSKAGWVKVDKVDFDNGQVTTNWQSPIHHDERVVGKGRVRLVTCENGKTIYMVGFSYELEDPKFDAYIKSEIRKTTMFHFNGSVSEQEQYYPLFIPRQDGKNGGALPAGALELFSGSYTENDNPSKFRGNYSFDCGD
jgi:hypothetical protein